ncbi:MAG: hypothetical protein ACR2GY_11105 [Phycisphaerales bacterium]
MSMQVLLDGEHCETMSNTQCSNLNDAVAMTSELAHARGRCVIEVHADGKLVDAAMLSDGDLMAAVPDEVNVTSAPANAVVRETWLEAETLLEGISTQLQQAGELVQTDQIVKAMELVSIAIHEWQLVQEAVVNGAAFAGIELDSLTAGDATIHDAIAAVSDRFAAMRSDLERRDLLSLADTLLYDLPEVLASWKHILRHNAEAL